MSSCQVPTSPATPHIQQSAMAPKEKAAKAGAKKAPAIRPAPAPATEPAAKHPRDERDRRWGEVEREPVRWGKRRAEQEEELNERTRCLEEREAALQRQVDVQRQAAIPDLLWPR